MDYKRTAAWWRRNGKKSGEALAREYGGDGAHWRRAKRVNRGTAIDERILRGVAVFDLHHPKHDKQLWANILRFASDLQPDVFVFGGDNMDLEVVSHWVGNKRRTVEGKRLKADYEKFEQDVLAPVNDLLGPDARRIFHLGNHEDWIRQYLDVHPEMEGFAEVENNLSLAGWEVYEYGQTSKVGKLHITHGNYTNIHNAYRTAQVYGRNVIYGHGHSFQAHTITAPLDVESHIGVQIPCACHMNPDYALNRPNAWLTGFAVFYVRPDGSFALYPVIAVGGAFVAPDGMLYE